MPIGHPLFQRTGNLGARPIEERISTRLHRLTASDFVIVCAPGNRGDDAAALSVSCSSAWTLLSRPW